MKILQVISSGFVGGGAENGTLRVKEKHEALGHEVRILSSDMGKQKILFSDYTFKSIKPYGYARYLRHIFNIDAYITLRTILKDWQPDVVHLRTMDQVSPLVPFLLKNYNTVATLHGPEEYLSELLLWYFPDNDFKTSKRERTGLTGKGKLHYLYSKYLSQPMYRRSLKNVNTFIAPSNYIKVAAAKDVSPIKHIPNGVELMPYAKIRSNNRILYVGRIEQVKGIDYLIKAVGKAAKSNPKVKLDIIGEGSYENEIKSLVVELNLSKNVNFIGWVSQKDLYRYYEMSTAIVIPSVWPENFPTVCNEAMSIGRPVIATKVGGIPELVENGTTGYLVPAENDVALAEAILKILNHEALAQKMGEYGRKKVEALSMDIHANKLIELYKSLNKEQS
jgi:glycosyltransferase involved in cell wall biosynthesis